MSPHIWPVPWLRKLAAVVMLAGLLAVTPVGPAFAQTITVTTTAEAPGAAGDCTLGEAVQAANSNAPVDACPPGTSSDVIVLAAGQTYTLTQAAAYQSAFVISGTITLQGNGASLVHAPLTTTLRFFSVTSGISLTLIDLTLAGGRAHGANGLASVVAGVDGTNGAAGYGGAIFNRGQLVLDGVTFVDNVVRGGNGGSGFPGSFTSDGGYGNLASGGGIYSSGEITIVGDGAHFTGNQAIGGHGGNGGTPAAIGGSGGPADGGSVFAYALEATSGPLIVADSVAQGGDGGLGAISAGGGDGRGGGLELISDAVQLAGAVFTNNQAIGGDAGVSPVPDPFQDGGQGSGGAIHSFAALTLSGSSLIGNLAQGGAGPFGGTGLGGAIVTEFSKFVWQHSLAVSNTAAGGLGSAAGALGGFAGGGALSSQSAVLHVDGVALVGNTVTAGANPATSTVQSARGGGMMLVDTTAKITNTTISLNQAATGGGLFVADRGITMTHVTVVSNTAGTAGGLATDSATIELRNSLVAYNAGGNCVATIAVSGENLQYPASTCGLATVTDPLLGPLGDYGGQTLTAPLMPGSPAIDFAAPAFCPATDQRGQPRPAGVACDLGAYEFYARIYLPVVRR